MSSATRQTRDSRPTHALVGYCLGGLGAAMFATKGIIIKLALLQNVDAVTTLTWRMLVALPLFLIVGWLGYRAKKAANPGFSIGRAMIVKSLLVGMLGYYVASYLDFKGLEYVSAQFDRLILLTYPIFVVLFGALLFKRPVSLPMLLALLISYAGLALIFAHDLAIEGENVLVGTALVLGAALAFAFYQLLAKPLIDEIGARLFTSIAMSGAGLGVVMHFLLTHPPAALMVSADALWLMLAIGTVSTVFPAYLISAALGRIGPGPTAVIGNVSPLVTIVLAVSVLGEVFSIYHAAGAALTIAGVLYFTTAERRAAGIASERMTARL